MSIEFQSLYNQTHQFNQGIISIEIPFTGNVLALNVSTKPEYLVNSQVIGYLYQYYQGNGKGYAIKSGVDLIGLELPETDSLKFVPTPFLSDSYTLSLSYTTVGTVVDGSNTAAIPSQILALPNQVNLLENDLNELELAVMNLPPPVLSWSDLQDKPASFIPSNHNHSISEVASLQTNLDSLDNRLDTLEVNLSTVTREVLTANRTYFVRTDGNDSNNGLINNNTGAFLTWNKAIEAISKLDGNGLTVTIKGTGNFPSNNNCIIDKTFVGISKIIIDGNIVNPSLCILNAPISGSGFALLVNTNTPVDIQGITFQSSTANDAEVRLGLTVFNGLASIVGNCDFRAGTGLRQIYVAGNSAILKILAPYTISGSGWNHLAVFEAGLIESIVGGVTNIVIGSINFTEFVAVSRGGVVSLWNVTFQGGVVSGKTYDVGALSAIYTIGNTAFRGNISGTVRSLGYYGS